MLAATHDLVLDAGATKTLLVSWGPVLRDPAGEPVLDADGRVQVDPAAQVDPAGVVARLQVRRHAGDTGTPLVEVSTTPTAAGSVTVTGKALRVVLAADATDALATARIRTCAYDLKVAYPAAPGAAPVEEFVLRGAVTVRWPVTTDPVAGP